MRRLELQEGIWEMLGVPLMLFLGRQRIRVAAVRRYQDQFLCAAR